MKHLTFCLRLTCTQNTCLDDYCIDALLSRFWGDADVRLVAYMVPDLLPGVELGNNGLPKSHPQMSNSYLFSIDVKHESNHPEMSAKNTTFSSDSYGVNSPQSSELTEDASGRRTELRSKKKFRVRMYGIVSRTLSHMQCVLQSSISDTSLPLPCCALCLG